MIQLILANLGTIAVFLVLAAIVGLIVRSLYKQKKRGGCAGCGGSCGACGGCSACHPHQTKT